MNQITSASAPIVAVFESASSVRIIMIDNEPWFVAVDIANALNFRNAPDMTRMLDDDEKGTHIVRTLGGNQELTVICESGLYAAILKSRKSEARKFRKWVTAEVLPSIRKKGYYVAPVAEFEETMTINEAEVDKIKRYTRGIASCLPTIPPNTVAVSIYSRIKSPLRIGRIDDLPASYFDRTMNYLERVCAEARKHHRQMSSIEADLLARMTVGCEVAA